MKLKAYSKFLYSRPKLPPSILPFKVRTAGFIENQPHHSTLGTYFSDAMIMFFIAGSGSYSRSCGKISISSGMIGVVLPESDIGILTSDNKTPYEHFYCRFSGTEALKMAARIRAIMEDDFEYFPDWTSFVDDFRRLVDLSKDFPPQNFDQNRMSPLDAQLALILSIIENKRSQQNRLSLDADRIIRYMNERISSPADLNKMAEYFNVSKEHLCRKTKKIFGKTIYHLWLTMKMDWAKSLLSETDFPIHEVALKCGYKDRFYFSRIFKMHNRCSPGKWRRKHHKSR